MEKTEKPIQTIFKKGKRIFLSEEEAERVSQGPTDYSHLKKTIQRARISKKQNSEFLMVQGGNPVVKPVKQIPTDYYTKNAKLIRPKREIKRLKVR